MFNDRQDAGQKLAAVLAGCVPKDGLVLGIPKGGIEVGYEVASALRLEFSVLICRKLPFPDNPESGFGAVAEDGSVHLSPRYGSWVSESKARQIIAAQKEEIRRRALLLRGEGPGPVIRNRHVILVDDGIAMGSTMRAAIMCCRNRCAARITVAVPVASRSAVAVIEQEADEVVVLLTPVDFRAVADVYRNWRDVSDEEAVALLMRARHLERP
ncbi:MAG: phosphoribosyltransferase [Kiritimatiellia bacterium]